MSSEHEIPPKDRSPYAIHSGVSKSLRLGFGIGLRIGSHCDVACKVLGLSSIVFCIGLLADAPHNLGMVAAIL